MNFEVTVTFSKLIIYSNLVLSPTASVLSIPEPAMYFPFGKHDSPAVTLIVQSSLLASFLLVSYVVLNLIHPLKFNLSS